MVWVARAGLRRCCTASWSLCQCPSPPTSDDAKPYLQAIIIIILPSWALVKQRAFSWLKLHRKKIFSSLNDFFKLKLQLNIIFILNRICFTQPVNNELTCRASFKGTIYFFSIFFLHVKDEIAISKNMMSLRICHWVDIRRKKRKFNLIVCLELTSFLGGPGGSSMTTTTDVLSARSLWALHLKKYVVCVVW